MNKLFKFKEQGTRGQNVQVQAVLITALVLVLCIFLSAGCAEKPLPEEQQNHLRFGFLPDAVCLPMVVAEKEGIFEEVGLEVDLIYFSQAMERDQAIQAGELDGAISDLVAVGFFKDSGFDISVTSLNEGSFAIAASPDSGISLAADLKGKKIGISQNTIVEFMLDEILANHNLTPDDVTKEVIGPIPLRREMLLQGQIDAACMPEPFGSLSVRQGAVMITESETEGLAPSVIIFTEEAITQKTQAIHNFYRAYRKAADLINADPSVYNDLLLEKLRFPEEIIDIYKIPYFKEPVLPERKDVDRYLNWLEGRIEKNLSYEDLITEQFVR